MEQAGRDSSHMPFFLLQQTVHWLFDIFKQTPNRDCFTIIFMVRLVRALVCSGNAAPAPV